MNAAWYLPEAWLSAPPFWLHMGLPAQQEEMYHSERTDNAVFPKCLLLDKSQRKELQK